MRIEVYEDGFATGIEILTQLKASGTASRRDWEAVRLKTSTYNLLNAKLQLVMLIKYVASEEEAYWTWLRDVPPPRGAATHTIRIPRANRLSAINWREVAVFARAVTDRKLLAGRDR